jgi:ribosome-associated toxin RatA of RatAB toxin-antitoxin module
MLIRLPRRQLFSLVEDVESYPTYLPGHLRAEIVRARGDIIHVEHTLHFIKDLRVIVVYRLFPPERIQWEQREGPFHWLEGSWRFEDAGQESFTELIGRMAYKPAFPLPGGVREWIGGMFLERMLRGFRRWSSTVSPTLR